jgi:hypothetical protein
MIMRKVIVFAAILTVAFSSCGNKSNKDPKEELIVSYSNALQEETDLSNKIRQAISKGDFAGFRSDVDSCLVRLDRETGIIRDIRVQASDENLKGAALNAIASFKELAEIGRLLNALTVNSTEQEYNDLISRFNNQVNEVVPARIEEVSKNRIPS